jgi:hypothetical protein
MMLNRQTVPQLSLPRYALPEYAVPGVFSGFPFSRTYDANGTWRAPFTGVIGVEAWGAGTNAVAGSGGGGGAYAYGNPSVTKGTDYTITVGASNSTLDTIFDDGMTVTANASSLVLLHGQAALSIGDITTDGGDGNIAGMGGGGGGGGSSGSRRAAGNSGAIGVGTVGGTGGAAPDTDAGAGGNGGDLGVNGSNATAPGAGGGGGGTGASDGLGSAGRLTIWYLGAIVAYYLADQSPVANDDSGVL